MSERTIARVCMLAAFLGSASTLGAQEARKPYGRVVNPNESGGAQYRMDKGHSSMSKGVSTDAMSKSDMSKDTMSKKSKKN
jgi:hypothetical protein